jgi:dolichol kinase
MSDSANLSKLPVEASARTPQDIGVRVRGIARTIPAGIRGELVRKSLHMLIAFVPSIAAAASVEIALVLLAVGTMVFAGSEYLRLHGKSVALITRITVIASRKRDEGHFVLGPVTLAIGAMLALLLYPSTAAAIAIYALAFGDSVASLVGRAFGRTRIIAGKTLEGSVACFTAVWLASLVLTGQVGASLAIAAVATVLEALPSDDMDNIILPTGVGLFATILLQI